MTDSNQRGAAVVEMAFVTILLALFVCGIVDLGRVIFTNIGVHDAAQEGARFAAYNPPSNLADVQIIENVTVDATDYPDLTVGTVQVTCPAPSSVEVRVDITVNYVTPLIGDLFGGSIDLSQSYTSSVLTQEKECDL